MFRFLLSKKGFTLVELLTVVIIMSILVAVSIPIMSNIVKKKRQEDCRNQRIVIETAVKQAMNGMFDNGKKQDVITFTSSTIEISPNYEADGRYEVDADTSYKGDEHPIDGETPCFILTQDANCFTLAELRGGYRPITSQEYKTSTSLDDYKEGCEDGYYLKKIKYQVEATPFYKFLNNEEVPVCPFQEDNDSDKPYVYYILSDGSVHCSCPECNEAE